jgi:hypothetical protein
MNTGAMVDFIHYSIIIATDREHRNDQVERPQVGRVEPYRPI